MPIGSGEELGGDWKYLVGRIGFGTKIACAFSINKDWISQTTLVSGWCVDVESGLEENGLIAFAFHWHWLKNNIWNHCNVTWVALALIINQLRV